MEPVRNHRNQIVVDAARLHRVVNRRERGQTLIEGPHLLADALEGGAQVTKVFGLIDDEVARRLAGAADVVFLTVDQRALERLAGTQSPRGPVAIVTIEEQPLQADRNTLVAWGVSDPGNVGTLIRTSASFGWAFGYGPGTADPWSPKALRSGAAGQFQTPITRISDVMELKEYAVVASVVVGGVKPEDLMGGPFALLIGEEAAGLPGDVVAMADHVVTIDTPGPTESLNAAVAAGVLVHELSKPRGGTKDQV